MPSVIVVPETEDFEFIVSHENFVWINENLGNPKLEERNATYLAPLWIKDGYVSRIYHIIEAVFGTERYIKLGNSFILTRHWRNHGQSRRFEYHDLKEFSMVEIAPGLLFEIDGS